MLPVVVTEPKDERILDLISTVEHANGSGGFAAHITGSYTLDHDFTKLSESDLSKGELQFGLPAALSCCCWWSARCSAQRSRC